MAETRVTIRKAGIRECQIIARFNQEMARETEGRLLDFDTVWAGVKAVIKDQHKGFYLVAEHPATGEIAGQMLITYEWSDWRNRSFWWIQSVYVKPEFRRQKIFGRLFGHVAELARFRRDVAGLRLYVEKHNQTAKQTYENLGMIQSGYDFFELEF